MDRGRDDRKAAGKLTAGFAACFLVFILAGGLCIYGNVRLQQREAERTLSLIVAQHPELESELIGLAKGINSPSAEELAAIVADFRKKYSYHAYELAGGREIIALGLGWLGTGSLCLAGLWVYCSGREKKERLCEKRERERLEKCLQDFTRGDYKVSESSAREGYGGIWERVKELGYACEARSEKMALEEQNTKALITDLSHQLKTPFASLKMSCELAQSQATEDKDRGVFLEQCQDEIGRLEGLLDVFVQLSRLENGMIRLRPERRSVREAVTGAVNTVIMQACRKQIGISLDMPEEWECFYDLRWTEEAFANLLDNAVKYSPEGAEIRIRVSGLGHYCMVEIEDQGLGIAKEEYHRVFQRFYRGARARESGSEGAGVGLYLARNIMEQQGGVIRIKPKSGRGSLFQILLPMEERQGVKRSSPSIRAEE